LSLTLIRRPPEHAAWLKGIMTGSRWVGMHREWNLYNAPEAIRQNREVVQGAICIDIRQLGAASEALRDDRELALAALQSWGGRVFEFISHRLQCDRELLRSALNHLYPYGALMNASPDLRNDFSIVQDLLLDAVRCHKSMLDLPRLIDEAPDMIRGDLRNDKAIFIEVLRHSDTFLNALHLIDEAHSALRQDKDVILEALAKFGNKIELRKIVRCVFQCSEPCGECRNWQMYWLALEQQRGSVPARLKMRRWELAYVGKPLERPSGWWDLRSWHRTDFVGHEWCRLDYPDHLLGDKDFVKKVSKFDQSSFLVTALEHNPAWQLDFWLMKDIILGLEEADANSGIFARFLSKCAELHARMVSAIQKSKRKKSAPPSALLKHEFDFSSFGMPSMHTLAILLARRHCAAHLCDASSEHEFARVKPRKNSRAHQR